MATPWYNRAVCYLKLKNYNLAVVDLNKCIYLDTGLVDAYFNRYLAYRNTHNTQFALGDITHYIRRRPADHTALAERADLAMELKEYDIAIRDLQVLADDSGAGEEVHLLLAEAYALNKDFAHAQNVIGVLLKDRPGDRQLQWMKAWYLHVGGDFAGSQQVLMQYGLPANDKNALLLQADNEFFMEHFEIASKIYLGILDSDSGNASVLADYGHCLLQLNRFVEAEEVLTRAIRRNNDNPSYAYLGRGIARVNIAHGAEACEDWEKSLMLGEKKAVVYLNKYCLKSGTQ
jgi:tetratricopeptide (TPR) repeat protein